MGWWRWRLARVLSLVYCQYYRPHVAISPEFRGRASDQSSDCWAPVSQSSSDHQAQSTPPSPPARATVAITKENFYSSPKQKFIWQLETLQKLHYSFSIWLFIYKFFEKDFSVEFSRSKKFLRSSSWQRGEGSLLVWREGQGWAPLMFLIFRLCWCWGEKSD